MDFGTFGNIIVIAIIAVGIISIAAVVYTGYRFQKRTN